MEKGGRQKPEGRKYVASEQSVRSGFKTNQGKCDERKEIRIRIVFPPELAGRIGSAADVQSCKSPADTHRPGWYFRFTLPEVSAMPKNLYVLWSHAVCLDAILPLTAFGADAKNNPYDSFFSSTTFSKSNAP